MGLQPPDIVKEATASYFEAEDAIAAWIDDCCEPRPAGLGDAGRSLG